MSQSNLAEVLEFTQSAFYFSLREDGVGLIEINVPNEKHNTLRQEFGQQFLDVVTEIRNTEGLKGVVICSTKPGSFLAGADINLFESMTTEDDASRLARECQSIFQQIEALPVPVVAAIEGVCVGGGLELALACDARVVADDVHTVMGLPEVMLGLLPAAGGTQRLPRLIGIAAALDMMLTGRQLRPGRALALGLADALVPSELLVDVAAERAIRLSARQADRKPGFAKELLTSPRAVASRLLLEQNRLGRGVLFRQARKQAFATTRGNFPAPAAIIDVVETGLTKGFNAGLEAEAREFGRLVMSRQSAGFRSLFHATESLKKESFVAGDVTAREVKRVGVLGAGLMGSGIALTSVEKADCAVRLKDRDDKGLGHGIDYLKQFYDKRVGRKILSAFEAERQLRRVTTTTDYAGFGQCDLVIEAVFENESLKHQMLKEIEMLGNDGTIFASNTSSIPISDIARVAERPENVIGMHYFSPVEKMPLLEIICTDKTSPEVVATCVAFGKAQGKMVIVVKDSPGFYTTRILAPYLNEAARMIAEGVSVSDIDRALLDFGFPIGPMSLMDEVGIDVGLKVGPILEQTFGERFTLPQASKIMQEESWLGRKTGRGFYQYETNIRKGKRPLNTQLYQRIGVEVGKRLSAEEIALRCVSMFVNEAAHCLGEGVLQQPLHGDVGAVFGLGFPPFLGGPFRYIDQLGLENFVAQLEDLRARYGERFTPAPLLLEMMSRQPSVERMFYR